MRTRADIYRLAVESKRPAGDQKVQWVSLSVQDLERFYAAAYYDGERAERDRLGAFVEELTERAGGTA